MNEQGGGDVEPTSCRRGADEGGTKVAAWRHGDGTTLRTPNDDRDNERAAWWGESPENRRATHHRGRHRAHEVRGITTTLNNRGRPKAEILEGGKKKKIPQSQISIDNQEITDNVKL